jgi:hypothetical protein
MLKRSMASTYIRLKAVPAPSARVVRHQSVVSPRGIGTMNPPSVGRPTTGVRKAFPDLHGDP